MKQKIIVSFLLIFLLVLVLFIFIALRKPTAQIPLENPSTSIQQSSLLSTSKKIGEIPNTTDVFDALGPFFSPDGQHFVYNIRKGGVGGEWSFELDGKEGKEIGLNNISYNFSPDSKHFAYVAKKDNKYFVVLDDKTGKEYDGVMNLQFSHDSQHFAYVAIEENKQFIVLDSKEGKKYSSILNLQFSSDGQHLIYTAMNIINVTAEENKYFIILNNNGEEKEYEYKQYDGVSDLIFSPDGQHFSYIAKEKVYNPANIGGPVFNSLVVSDGKEGERYFMISKPIFSPDSKHLAYTGYPAPHETNSYAVILNDEKVGAYNIIYNFKFTSDSKLTYNAVKETSVSQEVWYITE